MEKTVYYVEVVAHAGGEVVKSIGPVNWDGGAEQVERGVNINLAHDRYYTRIVSRPGVPITRAE